MNEKDEWILPFICKIRRDRVKLELKRNRKELLYKFATIAHYFDFSRGYEDLRNRSSKEILRILQSEQIGTKDVYILSTLDKYDGVSLDLTVGVLDELLFNGFPSVVVLGRNTLLMIGEQEIGPCPRYLLKR